MLPRQVTLILFCANVANEQMWQMMAKKVINVFNLIRYVLLILFFILVAFDYQILLIGMWDDLTDDHNGDQDDYNHLTDDHDVT